MSQAPAALPPGRLYQTPGITGRPTLSIVVVAVATVYGVFELVRAWRHHFDSQMDLLFGLFFVGGGIYGFNKTWTDSRDIVASIDLDETTRRASVAVWRPFRPKVIETDLAGLSNWRPFVRVGQRGDRSYQMLFDCALYPRPLRIELPRGNFPEGLRRIAPEAVAEYEELTGATPQA